MKISHQKKRNFFFLLSCGLGFLLSFCLFLPLGQVLWSGMKQVSGSEQSLEYRDKTELNPEHLYQAPMKLVQEVVVENSNEKQFVARDLATGVQYWVNKKDKTYPLGTHLRVYLTDFKGLRTSGAEPTILAYTESVKLQKKGLPEFPKLFSKAGSLNCVDACSYASGKLTINMKNHYEIFRSVASLERFNTLDKQYFDKGVVVTEEDLGANISEEKITRPIVVYGFIDDFFQLDVLWGYFACPLFVLTILSLLITWWFHYKMKSEFYLG